MAISTTVSFNLSFWSVQVTDGSWRITYQRLNQAVLQLQQLQQMQFNCLSELTPLLITRYVAIELPNAFFSIPVNKVHQKLQLVRPMIHLCCPISGLYQLSSLCHNLVCKDLGHFSSYKIITWMHSVGDIRLIGPSEQEAATTLDLLVIYLRAGGQEIYPTKIKVLSSSAKQLETQWYGAWQRISCCMAPPTTNQDAQSLVGRFGFGDNIFFIWVYYSSPFTE